MGRGLESISELVQPDLRARPQANRSAQLTAEARELQRTLRHVERLLALAAEERDPLWEERIAMLAAQFAADAPPVRTLHAAQLLGVSERTVSEWTRRGALQAVSTRPRRVTLASVLEAKQTVDEFREQGHDRDLLAALLDSQRTRTGLLRAGRASGHRAAELRSIALHRLIAQRLDESLLEATRVRVQRWIDEGGPVHPRYAAAWQKLLSLPPRQVARELVRDSQQMRDLRQTSPFAGVLSDEEIASTKGGG